MATMLSILHSPLWGAAVCHGCDFACGPACCRSGWGPKAKCAKNTSSITWYWLYCEELLGNFWPAGDWHHLLILFRVPSAEPGDHQCTGGVATLALGLIMVVMGVGASHSWPKQGQSPLKAVRTPILSWHNWYNTTQHNTILYYPIQSGTKSQTSPWPCCPSRAAVITG